MPARTHSPAEPLGPAGDAPRPADRRGLGIRWAIDLPVAAVYGVPLVIVRAVQVAQGVPDISPC
ncbi:hypothetical protein GCM10025866_21410 [Naasia aerilata]|uniref:Uncharacterized protein n=1 Tax=Naasia aerilata TaxID=1162966 RepID=A0ABN6XQU2_9MICO|nr:hypothetical protein GCM10025866_21410 [Naasia aerilata]